MESTSWAGASASTEQPTVLSHGAGSGSQPSLINLGNPATATPPLEPLTATPFVTQFGGRGALHSPSRSSTQDAQFKNKGGRDLEHNVPLGERPLYLRFSSKAEEELRIYVELIFLR